ncbi:MAG: hypothetical protein NXI23_26095 [Bacteroidetes bacterium]|jgi:hypothetical protein|nr:hypothetical protein [Bacteroidota bacterium]MDF1868333.1 hypothetical protein [Saprospiraceae bacterium]
MKNYILFSFILTAALITTSCQKEQIFKEEIPLELSEKTFTHLILPKTVIMKVSDKPFTAENVEQMIEQNDFNNYNKTRTKYILQQNNFNNQKRERATIYIERIRPCEHGDCDPMIEEYSQALQKRADESCEISFGEVTCCVEGNPAYVMMMSRPANFQCYRRLNTTSNDRTNEPAKVNKIFPVGIHIEECPRGQEYTLMAYDKETFKAYEDRRIGVDWFENDRYIGSGSQLNCITGNEITVVVQDLITLDRGMATITLPGNDDDDQSDIKNNDKAF